MLLVTAFEPFDGSGLNSSLEVLQVLAGRNPQIATAILPVQFGADVRVLEAALQKHQPTALLLLGQSRRKDVEIERIAINLKRDGETSLRAILEDAPAAYLAHWPVDETLKLWRQHGLTARDSANAGMFLCNHIFFHARHFHPDLRCTFVHLPRLERQVEADETSLPLQTLIDCMQIVVEQMR